MSLKKIKCIAVDDEPLALEQMKNYISQVDLLKNEGLFDNPVEALSYMSQNLIDLVFLDIEMDGFTGLQFVESLSYRPFIIMTTAYDKYAIKGFELEVTDYLLKPFSFQRFVRAVNKVSLQLNKPDGIMRLPPENYTKSPSDEYLFIRTKYHMQKVMFSDILYVKSMNNYMIIKTEKESIFTLSSFQQMQALLPSNKFVRIHKSYIISLDRTNIIGKKNVKVGTVSIPIGESYKQLFFKFLEDNMMINP